MPQSLILGVKKSNWGGKKFLYEQEVLKGLNSEIIVTGLTIKIKQLTVPVEGDLVTFKDN